MEPTKVYYSIIMFIIYETAADIYYDPEQCAETLTVIFELQDSPGKTAQMCYERAYYELTMDSVKIKNWDFPTDAIRFSENAILDSPQDAISDSPQDDSSQVTNIYPRKEYGKLYMEYLYSEIDNEQVLTPNQFCLTYFSNNEHEHFQCRLELIIGATDTYKRGNQAFKAFFNNKTRESFVEGTYLYMYYENVRQSATLAPEAMTPQVWCDAQMYTPCNRPENVKRREKRAIKRQKLSGHEDSSYSSENVQN